MNSSATENFSLRQAALTLKHKASPDGLYVEDIVATFGHRSPSLCIIFFTVPFLQPIPLLGLSTPFGFLLVLMGYLMLAGKPLRLPRKFMRKHVSEKIVLSSCRILLKILDRAERFFKPRFEWWTLNPSSHKLNGALTMIYAFLLALPLPVPFTNAFPAWFLIINAIGEVEEDGLLMFISYGIGISTIIFFFAVGLGANEIFAILKARI
jgi:hypothetical protein